jgi:hypothetical protein
MIMAENLLGMDKLTHREVSEYINTYVTPMVNGPTDEYINKSLVTLRTLLKRAIKLESQAYAIFGVKTLKDL